MSRWACGAVPVLLAVYLGSGIYIVPGNEKAAIRRYGKLDPELRSSGLYFDWPYPFSQIDRINFAAVKSIQLGSVIVESRSPSDSIAPVHPLLTGDQNLLQVRAQAQYRLAEEQIALCMFSQQSAEQHLIELGRAVLIELISQSGVDFVHVRGVSVLNERLKERLQFLADKQQLGLKIEQALIEQVEPPVRVKAEFLDVANAQSDAARDIQDARTAAEQIISQADSERQRLVDNAMADQQSRIAAAQGSADRFRKLTAQMRTEAARLGASYPQVRQLLVQRLSWQTWNEIWPKVRKKTILDHDGSVDIGVLPMPP